MEEIKMKDSGIKWIGKIPEDWDIKKVKYKAKLYTGNSIADNEKENYEDSDFALPYIATKDINVHNHNIDYENGMYIKKDDWSFKRAPKDSSLLCIEGGSAGKKIGYTNQPVCFVNKLCCFTSDNMDNKFLFYTLNSYSFKEAFNQNIFGLIGGVSTEKIKNIKITIPSVEEQKLIAGFLDKKCADIDEIISKTEKQIETLEHYKDSLITEIVTKGLNNNKTKQTNHIWFSEVPNNWKLMKMKMITSILTCGVASTPEYVDEDEGVLFLSAQNIQNGKLDMSIKKFIPQSLHKQLTKYKKPQNGDVLQVRVGATIGKSAIVDIDDEFSVYVSLTHIRANKYIQNKFLNYVLNTDLFKKMCSIDIDFAGSQGNLNVADLKEYKIPVPPIKEQKEISEFLDKKCANIDEVINKQKESLETLKKYKQSLIYEYVTGKKRV